MSQSQGTPYDPPAQPGVDPLTPGQSQDPYAETYTTDVPTTSYVDTGDTAPKTSDVAKDEAAQVKQTATDAGKRVADTAKDEAGNVAAEVKQQAKSLVSQTVGEVRSQADTQRQRLAGGIGSLGGELESLASGNSDGSGPISDLARQAAERVNGVSSWLEGRDANEVLEEVAAFARRRPWAFLAGAAIAGLVVGRFAKGLAAEASDQGGSSSGSIGRGSNYGQRSNYSTPSTFQTQGTYETPSTYSSSTSYEQGPSFVPTEGGYGTTSSRPSMVDETDYANPADTGSEDPARTDIYDRPYDAGRGDLPR